MSGSLLLERTRAVLQDLIRLAAERAQAESAVETEFTSVAVAARREFDEVRERIQARYEEEHAAAEAIHAEALRTIPERAQAEYDATERDFFTSRQKVSQDYATARDQAHEALLEARWTIRTVYEAGKKEVRNQVQAVQQTARKVNKSKRRLQKYQGQAAQYLELCGQEQIKDEVEQPAPSASVGADPFVDLQDCVAAAREAVATFQNLPLPRWARGPRLASLYVLIGLAAAVLILGLNGWQVLPIVVRLKVLFVLGGALAVGAGLTAVLRLAARKQLQQAYQPLSQAVVDGSAAIRRCFHAMQATHKRLLAQKATLKERRNQELEQTQDRAQQRLLALDQKRATEARRVEDHYPPRLAEIRARREAALGDAESTYQRALAACESTYQHDLAEVEQTYARQVADNRDRRDREWLALAERWQHGLAKALSALEAINRESAALFPSWEQAAADGWVLPSEVPPGLRFGAIRLPMAEIPHGIPQDERLREGVPEECIFLAFLPFPNRASMLLRTGEPGRALAMQTLRSIMMRFLTSLPPGKVRFTIIDPVGLGENFAAFMHLADYDEALVASRIWTEQQHIEHRLVDLTEHMENVIQKYLRNQFQTLEEYNAQAGEVAEPFRVLVVANFPTNFSIEAARRLVSITSSGARCGVYTLVTVDPRAPMPQGFNLKELEAPSNILSWKDGRFLWRDPDFEKYTLQLDAPPDDATSTRLLQVTGEAARIVKRVEVPFEVVAPPPEEYWTHDSRQGLDIPLGRAGATRLQHLKLGRGTAQHVLIAGKTGSGKSTLLHALITNLSLLYSPDEVEVYLVDFKKGVEFKTYAAGELPHARVVAIESEREFGLSVLQRLDAELKIRGDLFRDAGVQDIAGYRSQGARTEGRGASEEDNCPDDSALAPRPSSLVCPRILLIVDEFQEFFVEDDKISQEAALLLDRLVRQGRAFGIHVHLGSQTLSGAYSLARSTIDQMAVRIALQCSESDAYLILSKDNAAARLLSRPGEAIYNDANGLVEGNDVFQVVWLPDDRRDIYLGRIRALARQRHYVPPRPTIVFEGNIPADMARNDLLRHCLEAPRRPEQTRACSAWLGEAVAIKDPTAAIFQSQGGSNLLLVGQQEEESLALLIAAALSLAAQQSPEQAHFYLLDGTPVESPLVGWFDRLAGLLPHPVKAAGWREVPALLGEVAAEVDRRQKDSQGQHPSVYLLIYGLQRLRELRRAEDDFGFGRRGEERVISPAQHLANILREGGALGVHVLVWCDSLNNLNRSMDRTTLREFEMRVLFQMSAQDSSTLIDNPLASKLGVHRALFHSEDRAQPEKFRPYGLPTDEWLAWVRDRLQERRKEERPLS
jgi:ABC-type multidrug transport system fused ATPase/permease subunit